jgi:hypothetical protein
MIATVVYSLLSHDSRLLPLQAAQLRRHLSGLARIVVVEGPFGLNPRTSAGSCRLRREARESLGVESLEAPGSIVGFSGTERMRRIYRWLTSMVIPRQSERYALVMHGDLLPMTAISSQSLLEGFPLAGRGLVQNGRPVLLWTWLALDRQLGWEGVDLLHPKGLAVPARPWPAWDVTRESLSRVACLTAATDYRDADHFEWCEPCWLHVDKLSLANPAVVSHKLDLLRQLFEMPECGLLDEAVENLKHHALRLSETD